MEFKPARQFDGECMASGDLQGWRNNSAMGGPHSDRRPEHSGPALHGKAPLAIATDPACNDGVELCRVLFLVRYRDSGAESPDVSLRQAELSGVLRY